MTDPTKASDPLFDLDATDTLHLGSAPRMPLMAGGRIKRDPILNDGEVCLECTDCGTGVMRPSDVERPDCPLCFECEAERLKGRVAQLEAQRDEAIRWVRQMELSPDPDGVPYCAECAESEGHVPACPLAAYLAKTPSGHADAIGKERRIAETKSRVARLETRVIELQRVVDAATESGATVAVKADDRGEVDLWSDGHPHAMVPASALAEATQSLWEAREVIAAVAAVLPAAESDRDPTSTIVRLVGAIAPTAREWLAKHPAYSSPKTSSSKGDS